ncbi:hypothetical protein PUN28_002033 [Cardiocondyla obscurior]|uniref:Uncharacterized protein n=1 Tax=Cardiocondyla obscurior TaxID=286306 RepID=A0AAW2GSC5_9HYME
MRNIITRERGMTKEKKDTYPEERRTNEKMLTRLRNKKPRQGRPELRRCVTPAHYTTCLGIAYSLGNQSRGKGDPSGIYFLLSRDAWGTGRRSHRER